MSKISKIIPRVQNTNIIKKQIPTVDKPIVAYMQKTKMRGFQFFELKEALSDIKDSLSSTFESVKESVISAKSAIQDKVEKTTEVTAKVALTVMEQTKTTPEALKHALELKEKTQLMQEFHTLYSNYKNLLGNNAIKIEMNHYLTLAEMKEKIAFLQKEYDYEKTIRDLEDVYKKGADYFCPNSPSIIKSFNFEKIEPNNEKEYKNELKRLCTIFIENSSDLEQALLEFKKIIKNYFNHAGISLKEILELKHENFNKISERLPIVGVVPKGIRVKDQVKLTNLVYSDFEEIADIYVQKGIMNIISKYAKQYETIKAFANNKKREDYDAEYTEKWLNKLKEARNIRTDVSKLMLDIYAKNGYNLKKSCDKVKNSGYKDMAIKVALTIAAM